MRQALATFLTTTFGIEVVVDPVKGLKFATEQSVQMQAALSNIVEAFKHYNQLNDMLQGGQRYRLFQRPSLDADWQPTQFNFALANDAIIKAANVTKDPANGDVQVYDALKNSELVYFPAGGL
jgi:hypothetical protein